MNRLLRILPASFLVFAACYVADGAAPSIYLIELSNAPNEVLVHFDTEMNRTYELQFTTTLQCTNATGCRSNAAPANSWRTIFTVPNERFPNHYIVPHTRTNRMAFYRLRVT
jgi:hypothetical protein